MFGGGLYGRSMREFFTKEKPERPPIEFSLDGRVMTFVNPGWAPIVLMRPDGPTDITRTYLDWLGAGLSDEDGQWILDRLLDPNDHYDLEDITELILGIVQEATGRPTVPPGDSSDTPAANGSTDGRHLVASTPAT